MMCIDFSKENKMNVKILISVNVACLVIFKILQMSLKLCNIINSFQHCETLKI